VVSKSKRMNLKSMQVHSLLQASFYIPHEDSLNVNNKSIKYVLSD